MSPAQVGDWAIDVDDSLNPRDVIVWHRDAEVARLPYEVAGHPLADRLVTATGMPLGTANELRNQIVAKLTGREGRLRR
jgi:hypothetical protein